MRRAVLFDLDDTLFDFHRSEREALCKTLLSYGITPSDEMVAYYSRVNDSQWKLLEKEIVTREEVLLRRFDIFFCGIGVNGIDPFETWKRYESKLSKSYYFFDGAEELLKRLCRDYELYIVSNGTASVQDGRISLSGIGKYFKDVFISQRVGFNKPSHRFFELCFEKMNGLEKKDAVIIGDSLSSDIKGGRDFGIATVWYNPKGETARDIIPDFEASSYDEIPSLLEKYFNK